MNVRITWIVPSVRGGAPSDCGQTDPEVPPCKYRCEFSGCLIDAGFVGDEFCDCPFNCEEEADQGFVCGPPSCPCPQVCRDDFPQCDPVPLSELFLCSESGGCGINQNKVNDLTCDCPNCEDETDAGLDCVQCRCPAVCGQTVFPCSGPLTSTTATSTTAAAFCLRRWVFCQPRRCG